MPPHPTSLRFAQLLGIKEPIIQAPMAGISTAKLAAEVANNGALGSLPLAMYDIGKPEGLTKLIASVEEFRRLAPDNARNVNLNFFCHEITTGVSAATQIKNWWTLYRNSISNLDDTLLSKIPFENGNVSFKQFERDYPQSVDKLLEYLGQVKPRMVSFHFGYPTRDTIKRIQNEGILVFVTTTSIEETKLLLELGVDGLVCQGYEAGGHRGNFLKEKLLDENLSTYALFSQVRKYVSNSNKKVHLVAAGGIDDANAINYYLSLGASGVQLGSIFLATPESTSNGFIKKHVEGANDLTTTMIDLVSGKPARAIKTEFIENLMMNDIYERDQLPAYGHAYGAYKALKVLVKDHDLDFYLAGQNYHTLDPKLNTAEIIQKLSHDLAKL
ncbi:2-nitropropane dioxygenase [Scheffersomyces xylosifermentans]|uniref:2-nitropropane dioxygenase n=1 Tax=Scheffersomyces xylosifermentans TaxID=1304137 RepID=UPI00315C7E89